MLKILVFLLGVLIGTMGTAAAGDMTNDSERYLVGDGHVGLIDSGLTPDGVNQVVRDVYQGRSVDAVEPVGEGRSARVTNIYIPAAAADQPAIKLIWDEAGKIYRLEACSSQFMTRQGIHAGSSWNEIVSIYPDAKLGFENIIAFYPGEKVTCMFDPHANVDWEAIRSGRTSVPGDLPVWRLFTY
ncbi:MAG TPA: hypothetical protein VN611_11675 [Patescibacteria group bacterium]|nr:hypothetical protein [Patescibacteria group bacterium]